MVERLVWTPDLVRNFWDLFAQTDLREMSFGREGGGWLTKVLEAELSPEVPILDFGAGDGDLLAHLLAKGYRAAAFEPSEARSRHLQARLGGFDGFLGSVSSTDEMQFDVVLCSEVIEHVLSDDLPAFLDTLQRVVSPGGRLIVTTPNKENLEHQMALDPVNGTLFHRWQHQRTYSDLSLEEVFAGLGFETLLMHKLEFSHRAFVSAGIAGGGDLEDLFQAKRSVVLGDGGTLVYVGRKRAAPRSWHYPIFAQVRSTVDFGAPRRPPVALNGRYPFEGGALRRLDNGLFACDLPVEVAGLAMADPASILFFEGALPYPPALPTVAEVAASDVGAFTVDAGRLVFSSLNRYSVGRPTQHYSGLVLDFDRIDPDGLVAALGMASVPLLVERLVARLARQGVSTCAISGAGEVGQALFLACRRHGITIECLVDGHPTLSGCSFEGVPVRSAAEAMASGCRRFLLGTIGSADGMANRLRALAAPGETVELHALVKLAPQPGSP